MCAKGKPALFHVLQPFIASVGIFSILLQVVHFLTCCKGKKKKKKGNPMFSMSAPIKELGGA